MPLQPDFQNQKHLGFIWDPGLTGTPSRRGKAPSTMSREVLLSRRANSFFPQITWILDWKNAFCALKKTVAPFFVCLFVCFWLLFFCFSRYQEKWTHGTKENSFSESQLFACLGEGAGVAPKGPSPRGGRALFSAEMVFVCHSPIFPLESFLCFCSPSCLLESQTLFTTVLQREPSLPKRWHSWTVTFHGSSSLHQQWEALEAFIISCLLQNPKRPFPN